MTAIMTTTARPAQRTTTKRRPDFALAGVLAFGLAARLFSWRAVFRPDRVYYFDTDDYYHLRRMMAAAADFPHLAAFDPYLGFPTGFRVNWPSLYDRFGGLLIRVFAGAAPSLRAAQTVAALLPPLAGAATLWLVYLLARRLFGRAAALASTAIAAVLPLPVFYAMAGRPDHHCFENFWFAAILFAALRLLDAKDERGRAARAAVLAAVCAAGAQFWIGSLLAAGALAAFAAGELLFGKRRAAPRGFFWLGAALIAEGALLLPSGVLSAWGKEGAVLFDAPSLFQPGFAAAAGAAVLGFCWLKSDKARGRALGALAAAGALAIWLAARGAASIGAYLSGPVLVFRNAPEMQPLLVPFGKWGAAYVHANFGWAFWLLAPLAFLLMRASRRSPGRRLLLIWTAPCAALALWQSRYALELSLPAALLMGWGACRFAARFNAAAALLAALALLAPALKNLGELPLSAPSTVTIGEDLLDACDWLRENAPPTRSLWKDEGAPEYGVYALHDDGDEIAAIAQRPAAAGNMHFLSREIENSIAFFLMTDAEQAYAFLRGGGFRYVLLGDLVHNQTLQIDGELYRWDGAALRRNDGTPRASFWSLVYSRLYLVDGSLTALNGDLVPPVPHFRLVYESPHAAFGVARDKVFEVVPGARLGGACAPGAVVATVPVKSFQGRAFAYRALARCDAGRFELNAPYAGDYEVKSGNRVGKIAVADAEVETGTAKAVRFE